MQHSVLNYISKHADINTALDMRPDVFVTSPISYFTLKNLSTDLLTVLKRLSASGGFANDAPPGALPLAENSL